MAAARFRLFAFMLLLGFTGGRAAAQTYAISSVATLTTNSGGVTQLAIDAAGNFYYADARDYTVKKRSATGALTTIAGVSERSGNADGPAATALFRLPQGIALDAAGNLFVSDTYSHTIRKISAGGIVSTFAGQADASGFADGPGAAARFFYPAALALDAAGNLFVGDSSNYAIRKITPAGVVTTLARIPFVINQGQPFYGLGADGMAFDPAGNLFVADSVSGVIRKFTPAGVMTIVAGSPGQFGVADGVGAAAAFSKLGGLVIEPAGSLLVIDDKTLRRVTPDGVVTTLAGQVDGLLSPLDGVGGNARLATPRALALAPNGRVFFTDTDYTTYNSILRQGTTTTAPQPPILTVPPDAAASYRDVGEHAQLTLTSAAVGAPPLTFQWSRNGAPIAGATSATLTIPSVATTDAGVYSVTVSNAAGSFTSQPVRVTVYAPAFEAFTSRRTVAGGSFLWSIASGGGQLVTVGTGGKILTSIDGQTWTGRNSGTSEWLVGVGYGAGNFVVVGDHGTILISSDGATWTRASASGTAQRLNNVAFGGGRWVAVGEGGTIVVSTDAQTWTAQASGVTTWLRGLVYSPGVPPSDYTYGVSTTERFFVSGQNGVVLEGTNANWRPTVPFFNAGTFTNDIEALADGPTGIGQDGTLITRYSSVITAKTPIILPDGTFRPQVSVFYTWNRFALGLTARFRGLARGAGAIFATGEGGVIAAAQNAAGPWAFIPSGTTANLLSGVFHGNSLFIVGENETILQSQALYPSRLVNVATRGQVGEGASTMISGFVVSGDGPKNILLRAAGPALGAFRLGGVLAAPVLTLFDSANRPLATNTGWGTNPNAAAIANAATRVVAFPFPANSADSALLVTVPPGAYTAQVAGVNGAAGLALVEAYDTDSAASAGSRAVNLSTRGQVGTGANVLIAGFVINGAASRRVLIRAVGPSLAQFGLNGLLAQPQIALYDRYNSLLQTAGAWSAQASADDIRGASLMAGAFALQEDSQDAALVVTLLPGSYTIQVSGLNGTSGLAIVEVYDLP